ncbi:MAG: NfeD family protein, partial [Thermoanaerobaculia bacterium]
RTVVVDTMIGEEAITTDEIAPGATGRADLRGSTWSARNVGETPLAKGQRCTVERIDGLLLHIRAK